MGEWNRSTRQITIDRLRPEIDRAIQAHLETYNLGQILDGYLICIETISEKKKKGLFGGGGDKTVVVSAVLTPGWLVWGVSGDKSGTAALSAQLKEMVVTDYANSPGYKLLPDSGVEISGVFTGRVGMQGSQRVSTFIGLGEEPAANEFKEALFQAVQAVKRV
jgi:hypothetical protein